MDGTRLPATVGRAEQDKSPHSLCIASYVREGVRWNERLPRIAKGRTSAALRHTIRKTTDPHARRVLCIRSERALDVRRSTLRSAAGQNRQINEVVNTGRRAGVDQTEVKSRASGRVFPISQSIPNAQSVDVAVLIRCAFRKQRSAYQQPGRRCRTSPTGISSRLQAAPGSSKARPRHASGVLSSARALRL
jgi:hypothetical protein